MLTQSLRNAIDSEDVIPQEPKSLIGASLLEASWLERLYQDELESGVIIQLLHQYGLLPKLLQELIIDRAIVTITCDAKELLQAQQQFCTSHRISETELEPWLLKNHNISVALFKQQIQRTLKLEKYKQQTWAGKLESYFLTCKAQLDQVTYSLLRLQDFAMAQEIFFRIQSGEQTFADAAKEFSQGTEAQTGGLIGPTPISQPHPTIATRLKSAAPGEVLPPIKLGEWAVILRLEAYVSAQFDQETQQKLLENLFQKWLQESIQASMAQFSAKYSF
jgi:hypothetical protein